MKTHPVDSASELTLGPVSLLPITDFLKQNFNHYLLNSQGPGNISTSPSNLYPGSSKNGVASPSNLNPGSSKNGVVFPTIDTCIGIP